MIKKFIIAILILSLVPAMLGCSEGKNLAEKSAQELADAFENCDMQTIAETIFSASEITINDELSEVWGEQPKNEKGILEYIFEHVTVTVTDVTNEDIEYEIVAPDMHDVFSIINTTTISENELLSHIQNYAKTVQPITTTVKIKYDFKDGELIANYKDEKFINAITGGLFDVYKELYQNALKENVGGGN